MSCSPRSSNTDGERRTGRRARPTGLRLIAVATCVVLTAFTSRLGQAQRGEATLSDAEVEQLRESAYVPADRLAVFVKLLDTRAHALTDLVAKPHRPGREDDVHELLEQFTALADELNDNLDDYGPRHRDLRRQLPKLVDATDRWATALRSPPDNDTYNVARRLALESVRDVRQEAVRLVDEQRTYFAAHPDAAKAEKERESPTSSSRPVESPH